MLDLQVADSKKDPSKPGKDKNRSKEPKEKDPAAEANKRLQKDIKAFLNRNIFWKSVLGSEIASQATGMYKRFVSQK